MVLGKNILRMYVDSVLMAEARAKKDIEQGDSIEAGPYPQLSSSGFVYLGPHEKYGKRHDLHKYQITNPAINSGNLVPYLESLGFESVEVLGKGVGGNPSSIPCYVLNGGAKIQITGVSNLVTGQHIGWLAEWACAEALGSGGDFDSVVASDARLSKISARGPEDEQVINLREVYDRLVELTREKAEALGISTEGGAEVGGGDAKVDVSSPQADIHVKYNSDDRLVGIQQPKEKRAKKSKDMDPESAVLAKKMEEEAQELLHGGSTLLFKRLRRSFVNDVLALRDVDMTVLRGLESQLPPVGARLRPGWLIPWVRQAGEGATWGALVDKLGISKGDGLDLMSGIKGMEARLLYNDVTIRDKFTDYLESARYPEALKRDVVGYLMDFSAELTDEETGLTKRTYFFNYYGKNRKKSDLVDVDSLGLVIKSFKYKEPEKPKRARRPGLSGGIEVVLSDDEASVNLYRVLYDGVPVMKVEFRSIDGGGHPPQLHLLSTAGESGLFDVL